MIDNTVQRSRELFESGFWCAESVLMALSERMNIKSELIPRIATGFCAGISRTCNMCGALSGAIMAINLCYGRDTTLESNEKNYYYVQELIEKFKEEFGSTNCRDLTECDLGIEADYKFYEDNHLEEKCKDFVQKATEIAISLIDERF